LATGVLKKDVGTAAAYPDGMPTRPGNDADRAAADSGVPVLFPDQDLMAGEATQSRCAGSTPLDTFFASAFSGRFWCIAGYAIIRS
jgi:hypothetical protein